MKLVYDNKVYDTRKSKKIATVRIGVNFTPIYKTSKGAYFTVYCSYGIYKCSPISESEVKEFLLYQNYKLYAKLFGKLEEA